MKKLITSFCDAKVSIFVGLHLDVAADIDKTASLFDICQMEGQFISHGDTEITNGSHLYS